ncbi:MAG: hypothetical protein R2815_08585 [Flavobacteriales bacterium]
MKHLLVFLLGFVLAHATSCQEIQDPNLRDKEGGKTFIQMQIGDSLVTLDKRLSLSKGNLLNAVSMRLSGDRADIDQFSIIQFTMAFVLNGVTLEAISDGEHFSESQMRIMEKLHPGSEVYFEKILVKSAAGALYTAPSLVISVE